MRNRLLPLALLALAALAAGLWFAARGGGREGGGERAAARPPSAAPAKAEAQPARLAGEAGGADIAEDAAAPAPEARALATTEYENELKAGRWVEGRVLFPPETPVDEHVRVVAKGGRFEHGPAHSVTLGPDKTFRVAFPADARSGRLALEARYLFLDEDQKVDPADPGSVVLEPRLGGVVSGRVVPPPEASDGAAALVGKRAQIDAMRRTGEFNYAQVLSRGAELDEALTFTFRALPPDLQYDLFFDAQVYDQAKVENLRVQPGAEVSFELRLLTGVAVSGRVLDEQGAPLAGVTVSAQVENGRGTSYGGRRDATGADGAFELQGVSPGMLRLLTEVQGYEELQLDVGRLEDGAVRTGLELKLARGSSISGRVLWPDGTPAEGAAVLAEPLHPRELSNMGGERTTTDAAGNFTVLGLEPGEHRVSARATRKEQKLVMSELLGKEREKTVRTTLRATVLGVQTGAAGVQLELAEGEGFSGTVVDDVGASLDAFKVMASHVVHSDRNTLHHGERKFAFKDAHGEFTVAGLDAGTYSVKVAAEGHLESEPLEIEVPLATPLLPIRLVRAARVAGVVLTPQGEPAPRARIETTAQTAEGRAFHAISSDMEAENYTYAAVADGEGRFETDGMGLGTVKVRAVLQGYAPSVPLELALAPGVQAEHVTLRLGAGATLTGTVLDAGGHPLPRRAVQVDPKRRQFSGWDDSELTVMTDEAGAFQVAGLAPATYTVVSPPTEAELAALGLSASDGAGDVLSAKAEVEVPPTGAHIVLRAPEARPVRVHGTITAGGEPAAAQIWVQLAARNDSVSSRTDASGAYELLLPEPGTYSFSVHLEDLDAGLHREVEIGDAREQRFDLDVPVGSIAGRVLGPAGPLAGLRVELQRDDGEQGSAYAYATSDEDGRYEVLKLPAGTWRVQAGGSDMHRYGDQAPSFYTRDQVEGVVVASGQRVRDVDLHLSAAGAVTGRVLTAQGEPARGALIHARRGTGEMVEAYGVAQVDGEGRYSIGGLEPGSYTLGALYGLHAGAEAKVVVEEGQESQADIRLAPATLVRVVVRDAQGNLTEAHITCERSDGADFSTWVNWYLASDTPAGEHRIGPLPPGTYTVKADREGATPDTKTVTLKGEEEVLVDLVL